MINDKIKLILNMKLIYTKKQYHANFSSPTANIAVGRLRRWLIVMSASEASRLKVLVNSCHIGHYLRPVGSLDLTHVIDVLIAGKMEIA